MKMLFINRNTIVSIFVGMLLIYGTHGISYGQDAAPTVTPGENNTSLVVEFSAVCNEGEKAYQVQLRRKSPQGAWTTKCAIVKLSSGTSFLLFFDIGGGVCVGDRAIFGGLEPGVTYEARYRDTHLSECVENPPSPGPWSIMGEGTTHLVAPPRAEFVDATLAEAVRRALRLDTKGPHIDFLKIPKAELEKLTHFEHNRLPFTKLKDPLPVPGVSNLPDLPGVVDIGHTISEIEEARDASLDQLFVKDLTGLEHATQLTVLSLPGNKISDITPLTPLIQLTALDLRDNKISDVIPLIGLTSLKQLWLAGNPITDTSPLRTLIDKNPDIQIDIAVTHSRPTPKSGEPPTAASSTVRILPAAVASPAVGELLEIHLNITDGEAVAGYQASVQFDTTALRFVSGTNGDFLPAGAFFVEPKVEGALVKLNAASLAGESSGDGTLATLTFEVVKAKASRVTLSDVLLSNKVGESAIPKIENAQITEPTGLKGDVNGDGIVNIQDLVLVASNLGTAGQNTADVNDDGIVNIQDLVLVAGALGAGAAAPSLNAQTLSGITAADVQQWLSQAQQLTLTDVTSQRGVVFLEQILATLTPKETALLANYPNPFNPETWIPYQLAKDANVTLHIYTVNGTWVRTLMLGHQPAGMYQTRSRAAYWDGRNAAGESVASGVYFYTLITGEFTETRKMLVRK